MKRHSLLEKKLQRAEATLSTKTEAKEMLEGEVHVYYTNVTVVLSVPMGKLTRNQ